MSLSVDLISQFVKATNDEPPKTQNNVIYGTIKIVGDSQYVELDGSDGQLTPISTVTDLANGDRVCVEINNHTATVTGNITSPAARIEDLDNEVLRVNGIVSGSIQTNGLVAKSAEIGRLKANYASINNLDVGDLEADEAFFNDLFAKTAFIQSLDGETIHANFANFDEASARSLLAAAAIIQNATIDGVSVTELIGVTINGDLIQAGTLVAEKLVVKTDDGLFYKINVEALGEAGLADIEDLSTLQNGLHGAVINDKTIVAEKINVSDLVAFDATIAGFNIKKNTATDHLPGRLYSGSKGTVNADAIPGIYLDDTGQMNVGDSNAHIKFYKDNNNQYKLDIKANDITLGSSGKTVIQAIDDISETAISGVDVEYYSSTSSTSLAGGSWSTTAPTWMNGRYIWSRTKITDANGDDTYTTAVCITGNTGAQGPQGNNGTNGVDGRAVELVTTYYLISDQNTGVEAIGGWGSYVDADGNNWYEDYSWLDPLDPVNKYLWSFQEYTDANGDVISVTAPAVIGVYGDTGQNGTDGKSIGSVINYYLATASSSGVTTSTPGWTTSVQNVSSTNKYLWNYEVIKYTDNSVASTTSPCIIGTYGRDGADGQNGTDGTDGKGISSIIEYYLVSSSSTGITNGSGTWYTTLQPMTSTNKYLWNYELITYTDGTAHKTIARVIGVYGDKGNTGDDGVGVSSIVEEYYLSTSSSIQSGGEWSTTPPTWKEDCYIWTRSHIYYDNNTNAITTPVLANGLNNANETASNANKTASEASLEAENAATDASYAKELADSVSQTVENINTFIQNANGWEFRMTQLQDSVDDIGKKTEYVTITSENNQPVMTLGNDGYLKLKLTNEDIKFMVGSSSPTKIDNNGVVTQDITVEDEFIHGGFIWKTRSNGNLGLTWKGVDS